MTSVAVITPFRSEQPDRVRNLEWTSRWWSAHFPEYEHIIRDDGRHSGEPWCKGAALNRAVADTNADILIVNDADFFPGHPATVSHMVSIASQGGWAIPELSAFVPIPTSSGILAQDPASPRVRALVPFIDWNAPGRQLLLASAVGLLAIDGVCQVVRPFVYRGGPGFGMVGPLCGCRREHYLAAGGVDERFLGWGAEDAALGLILEAMLGPVIQSPGFALHLYHEGYRMSPPETDELYERYYAARGDLDALLRIGQEGTPTDAALAGVTS